MDIEKFGLVTENEISETVVIEKDFETIDTMNGATNGASAGAGAAAGAAAA